MQYDLEALKFGKIFGRGFSMYFRNFGVFSLVLVIAMAVLALPIIGQATSMFQSWGLMGWDSETLEAAAYEAPDAGMFLNRFLGQGLLWGLLLTLIGLIVLVIVEGFFALSVSKLSTASPLSPIASLKAIFSRLGPLLGLSGLRYLIVVGPFLLLYLVPLLFVAPNLLSTEFASGTQFDKLLPLMGAFALMFFGAIVSFTWIIIIAPRLFFWVPALVVEKLGIKASLKRSFALVKGSLGQIYGLIFSYVGLIYAISLIVFIALMVGTLATMFVSGNYFRAAQNPMAIMQSLLTQVWIATGVLSVILLPFGASYLSSSVSIYLNARVKKESLDQATLLANIDQQ